MATFFRFHRGHQFASSALMDPISKTLVAALEEFARRDLNFSTYFPYNAKQQLTHKGIGSSPPEPMTGCCGQGL